MNVHFHASRRAVAPAATVFEVLTDYAGYPRFRPDLRNVRVVRKDDTGAEFVADRATRGGTRIRAYDRYEQQRDLVVERTNEGDPSARSTWTIHAVNPQHSRVTVAASRRLGRVRGAVMRPFLERRFLATDVTPFITEAERRAAAHSPKGHIR